jgi:Na+-translocating ferredoxin:NAD+ oxidoreductase subunit B
MAALRGEPCKRPMETCLSFGDYAQFYIDNGVAKQITKPELMDLLKVAEESALVISSMNTKDLSIVCLCCSCCCGLLNGIKALPESEQMVNIQFHAFIDSKTCIMCEQCIDQCQVETINNIDDVIKVNSGKCIGCGLCLPVCPVEAISFVQNPNAKIPSDNLDSYFNLIRRERGINMG